MTVQLPSAARHTLFLAFALATSACGPATVTDASPAVNPPGQPQPTIVTVSPPEVTIVAGSQQVFAAVVTGSANAGVTWLVSEGAAGGAVSTVGAYTAPTTPGTYHVVARSNGDPTIQANALVTVTAPPPPISITLNSASASVFGCQSTTFTADVTGSADTSANWAVVEAGGGTVTSSGVYTAPAAPGTYHVTATSHADPTRIATAAVSVTTKVLSVTLDPPTISVPAGGTAQFTATVSTTCGTTVALRTVSAISGVTVN
jgi:hypothetical protein